MTSKPQEIQPGWWCNLAGDYYFVWGTVRDYTENKRCTIFVPVGGPMACEILSLEVNLFRDQVAKEGLEHVESGPRTLPPDFPTNLYVNKTA